MDIVIKAANFAAIKHQNQRRKSIEDIPYINHPIDVANILCLCGITDPAIIAAGLLHDTIEDTNTTYKELESCFGERIANIVAECTDNKSYPKVYRKQLQITHNDISEEAKMVKLADKYSNISSQLVTPPKDWSKQQIEGYIYWSYAVVQSLQCQNQNLVKKLNQLFNKIGISPENLQAKLNEYYSVLLT